MTNNQCEDSNAGSNRLQIVLALLAFSVFINYIDRGNLSIAAPMLKDELRISASQLGVLLSSFLVLCRNLKDPAILAGLAVSSNWAVEAAVAVEM